MLPKPRTITRLPANLLGLQIISTKILVDEIRHGNLLLKPNRMLGEALEFLYSRNLGCHGLLIGTHGEHNLVKGFDRLFLGSIGRDS